MVITGLTRNQFAGNRTWVRIPSSPPEKDANLDTKVSVFSLPGKPCAAGLTDLLGAWKRFSLFFGCKRRLMLVSPYSALPVRCMIKRLLVVALVADLYWVHPFFRIILAFTRPTRSCNRIEKRNLHCAFTECMV